MLRLGVKRTTNLFVSNCTLGFSKKVHPNAEQKFFTDSKIELGFFIPPRAIRGLIFRSTPKSRLNNMGKMSVRYSVRPSTKSFSDSDKIWYVGMPYDPIQGQGHETFKVKNSSVV